jgi:hypothetical protein
MFGREPDRGSRPHADRKRARRGSSWPPRFHAPRSLTGKFRNGAHLSRRRRGRPVLEDTAHCQTFRTGRRSSGGICSTRRRAPRRSITIVDRRAAHARAVADLRCFLLRDGLGSCARVAPATVMDATRPAIRFDTAPDRSARAISPIAQRLRSAAILPRRGREQVPARGPETKTVPVAAPAVSPRVSAYLVRRDSRRATRNAMAMIAIWSDPHGIARLKGAAAAGSRARPRPPQLPEHLRVARGLRRAAVALDEGADEEPARSLGSERDVAARAHEPLAIFATASGCDALAHVSTSADPALERGDRVA